MHVKYFDSEHPEIKARTVACNELAFSFLTFIPIVPGHLLICPYRVTATELTFKEWKAVLELREQVCQGLKRAFDCEGFNFAWNAGENAGQTVPHFHLHVVPRKKGDTGIWQYDPRAFLYRPGSRAQTPAEELLQVAELVRQFC